MPTFKTEFTFTPEIETIFTAEFSTYSLSFEIDFLINTISQTSLNDSIYTIIANIVQTIKKKDNKAVEKTGDLRDDLNVEKQPKDPHNNLGIIKRNTGLIPNPDFNIDHLKKPPIAFKPSNLRVKIFENVFYIITKNGIYVYSKDPQKVRVFQKIYKKYLEI